MGQSGGLGANRGCSWHIFTNSETYESTNFYHEKCLVFFSKELQSFFMKINNFSNIFDLPCFKIKQEKFREKNSWIRRFGIRENISPNMLKVNFMPYVEYSSIYTRVCWGWMLLCTKKRYDGKLFKFKKCSIKQAFFIIDFFSSRIKAS